MPRTTKRSARRAGFTMVEMLVVITIIAILISLTAAGALKLIGTQQTFNTKTELTRLDAELQRAYRSAADKFRKEPIPTSGPMNAAYYTSGTGVLARAGGDPARAQVIWTKLRLKQTFPNSFAEAWNPTPLPGLSYYKTKLAALGYTDAYFVAHTVPFQWESSVCLLWALQRGEGGTAIKESDFGTGSLKDFGQILVPNPANPSSGGTPNLQPVKGLIDDWGTPLYFCRWPAYSYVSNPNGIPNSRVTAPQVGDKNDSDDPSGLLEATNWQMSGPASFSVNANTFMTWCHPLVMHPSGEAQTYRIFPLIVSAGPDKKLGLDTSTPPPPPTGAGYFAMSVIPDEKDNLYPALASPK
jgi:prepilin-type N-terminal cleavage/methylation domain-containing protein